MTKELAEAARKLAQADLKRAVSEGRTEIQAGLARQAERLAAKQERHNDPRMD